MSDLHVKWVRSALGVHNDAEESVSVLVKNLVEKAANQEAEIKKLTALLNESCCYSHGEVIKTGVGCDWCDAAAEVFSETK